MNRTAPVEGYDFGRKRNYRRNIYAGLKKTFPPHEARSAIHLLMPSKEGAEITNALDAGFQERNLIIVDRSPQIVAVLKRTYKEATAYGIERQGALGNGSQLLDSLLLVHLLPILHSTQCSSGLYVTCSDVLFRRGLWIDR